MASAARRNNRAIVLILIISAIGILTAVTAAVGITNFLSEQVPILPTGELRVGVDISYPPFATLVNGEFSGIDIEIARSIGERMDVPVRIVPLGFDGLYDALYTDQVDTLISALVINASRLDRVNYSTPYFNAGLVLVTNTESPIHDMTGIGGERLAIAYGSTAQSEAQRWLRRIPTFEVLPYERAEYALDAVRLHSAQGALVDSITARLYLREHPTWQATVFEVTVVPYAIASRADRGRLSAVIDSILAEMQRDGTLNAILDRYL